MLLMVLVFAGSAQPSKPSTSQEAEIVETTVSSSATQTVMVLSQRTPRKRKLHEQIHELTRENKLLKHDIAAIQVQQETVSETQQLENLCDKLLPTQLAMFVKTQLKLINRTSQGRRYSNAFKKFSLSLFFLGPKCYKQLQKNIFFTIAKIVATICSQN